MEAATRSLTVGVGENLIDLDLLHEGIDIADRS